MWCSKNSQALDLLNAYIQYIAVITFSYSALFSIVTARRTRSMYEYRVPLIYIEPIAELEAVDTHPI